MEANEQIGGVLRAARRSRKLSQRQLAGLTGLTEYTISKIECGKWNVTYSLVFRILRALHYRMDIVEAPTE